MPFWKPYRSEPADADRWRPAPRHPLQQEKLPPCRANCPSGTDIRGWIAEVAQRAKVGLGDEEAMVRAWRRLVEFQPLPAVLGRVCPHPCERECNRGAKDAAVAIHSLERWIGDFGIARGLALARQDDSAAGRSVGVIGAGPAGLSFAYQMARRGCAVTVYEANRQAGGMLRYGIPAYRLPREVLDAEIRRILDLGVELRLATRVGVDEPLAALFARHDALFVGIGASRPLRLDLPGETGPGMWAGTDLMHRYNSGERPDLGARAVVVGGGNTAIDAARAARRLGAAVTMLYRRTRAEMPAIREEVDEALAEGIEIRYLAAPARIERDGGRIRAVVVQEMEMGEPDASGRAAPIAVPGFTYVLAADAVIAAVSQQPDWRGLEALVPGGGRLQADGSGAVTDTVWSGGDVLGLGTVTRAVGHGRRAAEALLRRFAGVHAEPHRQVPVTPALMRLDYYAPRPRAEAASRPVEFWLTEPELEIRQPLPPDEFLAEAGRCLSCGRCFGCGHCFMYCGAGAYRARGTEGGAAYFAFDGVACEACGKCIEVCPCGFLNER